ncbi:TIGR01777 family protein [Parahaliea maris]|uniref:TIGR01777 family protein n=1 Tax=Parahaliea maris TaxID=2716870 RepID=A0A5C8ZRY9_9GAMM|nr:TIGR01777 family oxidoreductase [Parahaliea maris]TXS91273.1 TIGR01777 family protein [Parahaliea maris]
MRILITGGTGFIGRALVPALMERGDSVVILSRQPDEVTVQPGVTAVNALEDVTGDVEAVVNLTGAPIVDRRWSAKRKALLRSSRIETTEELVRWMSGRTVPPSVLVSGSAVGYYGSQQDGELDEESAQAPCFPAQLCSDWEQAALAAESASTRVCLIRTGIVLGAGGALAKMLPAFRMGLGGPIGDGRQWMSWIHINDEVGAILHLLDSPGLRGAFNLTAPEPVTNEEFTRTLAGVLRRPAVFRVPARVMKVMLGEASELLVEGQRVVPVRLQASGYAFVFPSLAPALRAVIGRD